MSYREAIPAVIRDQIKGWGLGNQLHRLLWEKLRHELRFRDEQAFGRCVAPVRCLILPLSLTDPETGDERSFVFYIDTHTRPGERTVVYAHDLDQALREVPSTFQSIRPTIEP